VTLTGGEANLVIDQATVRIRDNFNPGQDFLSVDGVAATSGIIGGLNWSYDGATGVLTLTGNGSAATYQNALRLITYRNTSQNPSSDPRTIAYTIGGGATPLGSGVKTVNVIGIDDIGILQLPLSANVPLNTPGATIAAITVDDIDSTYTYTVDDARFEIVNGQLRLKAGQSITTAGDISLLITAIPNTAGAATLSGTFSVTGAAAIYTIGGFGTGATYTEDAPAGAIASGLTIDGGVPGATLNGAQVVIDGFVVGQDTLNIAGAAAGALSGTITGTAITWTYSPATGTLIFSGADSVANYQTALRQVVYSNISQNPSTTPRTIQYTIGAGAPQGSLPLTVTPINDAPTGITFTAAAAGPIAAGGVVGTIAVQDPDSTTFTYTFTSNGAPDDRFEVVPGPNGTLSLKLKAGQTLSAPVTLSITANDGGTPAGALTQVFPINPGPILTAIPQPDLLFFDANGNRKVIVWTLNNANELVKADFVKYATTNALGTAGSDFVLPSGWTVLKTGDFNNDGTPDILSVNAAGSLQVWYLKPNGQFVGTTSVTLGGNGLIVPAGSQFAGLADMDKDGNLDIVTQDPTAQTVQIWRLNGSGAVIGNGPVTVANAAGTAVTTGSANWKVLGFADFDGDGDQDILLNRDDINVVGVWRMNGTQFVSGTGLGTAATATTPAVIGFPALPAGYKFGAVGDFTGDGKADTIWRDASDNTILWTTGESGGAFTATQTPLPALGNGLNWEIAGATDLNNDNTADLVIRNATADRQVVWLFNNGQPTPRFITNNLPGATTPASPATINTPGWKVVGLGEFATVTAV
jgi:hypothetical protein